MAEVLRDGSRRQLPTRELAEPNGDPPAHRGRQSRPSHHRCRQSLLHGASRPTGSTPATPRGQGAAPPSTDVALQTFRRGWFENRIKECQLDLFADRTSAKSLKANQLRLWFASMAYVLVSALRRLGLGHTGLSEASCGTIRLKLLKLGARVNFSVRRVKIALASACANEPEWRLAFARLRAARAPPG